jgi:hypothetical protein
MGLDVWLEHNGEEVNLPSETNPEHLFRVGYWRSSYNGGGFNSVVGDRIGLTLYDFGGPTDDESYVTTPDWETVLEDAAQAKRDLQDYLLTHPNVGVTTISPTNMFEEEPPKTTENEALEIFAEEVARDHQSMFGGGYSNKAGHFWLDGLKVVALIRGRDLFDTPALHVVYEQDDEFFQFYLEALDIIGETAEYVLNQPDPENYTMIWSG